MLHSVLPVNNLKVAVKLHCIAGHFCGRAGMWNGDVLNGWLPIRIKSGGDNSPQPNNSRLQLKGPPWVGLSK